MDAFSETGDGNILEAEFVVKANDILRLISDKVKMKNGKVDHDKIFFEFKEWLRKESKKKEEG